MSPSFVSSARRRRHGGLASAALFHPLVEAATGALPVIAPPAGPVDSADARPGSAPATPAQGTEERRSSPEAGSARG